MTLLDPAIPFEICTVSTEPSFELPHSTLFSHAGVAPIEMEMTLLDPSYAQILDVPGDPYCEYRTVT